MPPPSAAFPRKKKPALTAKEAMKAKVQARSGKKAAKPAPDGAAERTTNRAADAGSNPLGDAANNTPHDARNDKPRDAASNKPGDAAGKPRDTASKRRNGAATASSGAAPTSVRRDQEQAAASAPATKPGLLRRLLNLFRRSG
ncbi:hypothetical protein [Sorangium sp. So ce513]|uniref:hypothetical protein n=1 Tax=Sorangium sp. So ce513 TaxID=3133315 RepID=UPI003F5DBE28